MSSTTDRPGQKGQVLVLFAGGLVTLLIVAALAFDVGMMLTERRDQQNTADAAALAGARYVTRSTSFHGSCSAPGGVDAVVAACEVAAANGFLDSASDEDVFVDIPPVHAAERIHRAPGNVEVRIASQRPSIFGGVIGQAAWPVGVIAIASNQKDISYPFGMLALNETECKAIQVSGTGQVYADSAIQSNSTGEDCGASTGPLSLSASGGAIVHADGCRAAGDIQDAGGAVLDCGGDVEAFSFGLPDPLRTLQAPPQPPLARAMKEWVAGVLQAAPLNIPDYCPGASAPKDPKASRPRHCVLGQGGAQAGRKWVLYPGLYPGGIEFKGGVTVYLTPGIYWIGGGGFQGSNDAAVINVPRENTITPANCVTYEPCGNGDGVLIYNTAMAGAAADRITLGGGGVTLSLMPYRYPFAGTTIDLVIFQDRSLDIAGDDVTLNGADSTATAVRGIVYVPEGQVKVNGGDSEFTLDQIIADTFTINGSGGTVRVLRETGINAVLEAAGLVE